MQIKNFRWKLIIRLCFVLLLVGCSKDEDVGIATRDDFLGTWQCEEYDANQGMIATFQVVIEPHLSEPSKIIIDNFNLLGIGYKAEAIVSNTFIEIGLQTIGGTTVSGDGFISDKNRKIEIQYTLDEGTGQEETIQANFTKL